MGRHLRNETANYNGDEASEFTDEKGIIHTTTRSMKRINYAEIEEGLDYLDDDEKENIMEEQQPKFEIPYGEDAGVAIDSNTNANINDINNDDNNNNNNNVDNYDDDEDDDQIPVRKSRGTRVEVAADEPVDTRSRSRRRQDLAEDDESFHEDAVDSFDDDDDVEEDDYADEDYAGNSNKHKNYTRRKQDTNFVVPDPDDDIEADEDEEEFYDYSGRRRTKANSSNTRAIRSSRRLRSETTTTPTRNLRRRTRSAFISEDEFDANGKNREAMTLQDEIRELQEDSPINEKRSLRERTKPVNYTIPPPLLDANQDPFLSVEQPIAAYHPSPRRGRGANTNQNMGPARRLFPTGGPFGGNDVTTIFGRNTNFYNQDNAGKFLSLNESAGTNNKRLIDSDSSEDEILPLGATPKAKPANAKKKKKKPEIADLDPLGVDMDINFEEVGGLDNYIDQLKEMVTLPLLYPEVYQNFNITPPRGVLFHGPPGTGKTLMARALAASCSTGNRKITFFMRKGADILSKWVGEAERQLRLLFEEAKKQQPSIIFFDEIDGLAPVRSSKQEQIHSSIVSTMLALMDGMDNRGQVIVIGATNRPDAVDPALRRPGRFDREFYFPLPDVKARSIILGIHTKKWNPPPNKKLIDDLARLTKGYGGADLRSLCTEAALISIQRKFPQIYKSEQKLMVDPTKIRVSYGDFMLALEKIVPSSARSTGSVAQPLPEAVKPLLDIQLEKIKLTLDKILPKSDSQFDRSQSMIQQFIDYEDYDSDDNDSHSGISGFAKHSLINKVTNLRICQPKLLVSGEFGNGQQYIGSAILNILEKFNVQKLDLASLVSDSSRSIESAVVQSFIEARKRQPSIVYIPNIDIWAKSVPANVILLLSTLFRSLQGNEKVLLLGLAECGDTDEITTQELAPLNFSKSICNIDLPTKEQKEAYFHTLLPLLKNKPTLFEVKKKRRKPLPVLPPIEGGSETSNVDENGNILSPEEALRRKLKEYQYQDMRLKNVLKIKLSGLMDLFKNRYKRFKKPPIDDAFLVHLFEPQPVNDPNWLPAYVKDDNMILEVSTGRRFHNMDLDIVEERLWNGYYSEPKQFLKDIELIYHDANTTGDRERIIKASEMFANAQMGIEDLSTKELIDECKATRKRDIQRQQLFLKDEQKNLAAQLNNTESTNVTAVIGESETFENVIQPQDGSEVSNVQSLGVGSGNQLQAQLQLIPPNSTASIANETNTLEGTVVENGINLTTHFEPSVVPDIEMKDKNPDECAIFDSTIPNSGETKSFDKPIDESLNKTKDSVFNKTEDSTVKSNLENTDDPILDEMVDEREITIDETAFNELLEHLQSKTNYATVSQLEELYTQIVNIIWHDRLKWDKSSTIQNIKDFIKL
ncbi:hypothetical protein Kpol_513p19 [Vanderwaltozyma polyspora DSM 70294]|uniref:Bromo domain-containing protein n=1 Tax=Vanderwaltozyma polyspora (strain ATCC 22028 / DSM 70294 / BCRC 21397 / CBS 2163 / NBRC 10782 / NRRL Y-8283 / UCD 57-17) TaxID=436907 RepID=A7TMK5_VANPO|nr:uncharacterized protein Kpol_513p19 [Vanderwaltozyma polyspora DSM 70294]EDO16503.1 hypothetical protein Kpol_513p19 [Vanderwaltozyma polyspora DSM 70294]